MCVCVCVRSALKMQRNFQPLNINNTRISRKPVYLYYSSNLN